MMMGIGIVGLLVVIALVAIFLAPKR